jgi:hypothetical protein
MIISKNIRNQKKELIQYFRDRASEMLSEIYLEFGKEQYKEQASSINKKLIQAKERLILTLEQQAQREKWTNEEKLACILMISYTNYIVMLESRNDVWTYDYMAFSRRIGELWEPFCRLCFEHPINNLQLFIPPLFSEVKHRFTTEIDEYINSLNLSVEQKAQLKAYYQKVWILVTSGEVQLELDLHFEYQGKKYVVDFKSGFGSNEKGNTNRLLLVGTIYKNLEENYECYIFVRSTENNHYFATLKNSTVWNAYSGDETYSQIQHFTGFNITKWIETNIDWANDLKKETQTSFEKNGLMKYLTW